VEAFGFGFAGAVVGGRVEFGEALEGLVLGFGLVVGLEWWSGGFVRDF
jgi:hypothetical protein